MDCFYTDSSRFRAFVGVISFSVCALRDGLLAHLTMDHEKFINRVIMYPELQSANISKTGNILQKQSHEYL